METLETYYARRAAEYEKIYHKPERQSDLARLRTDLPSLFDGERVLELACGTGYWTPLIAARAEAVVAVDYNEETLQLARTKPYVAVGYAADPPNNGQLACEPQR